MKDRGSRGRFAPIYRRIVGCRPAADQFGAKAAGDPNRSTDHDTAATNFMNDPIGLIYHAGSHHMLLQIQPVRHDRGQRFLGLCDLHRSTGGAMSTHNGGARSADRSWRNALDYIAVDGRCISALEVSDFCSVLYLAERVHVVGRGGSKFAANRLATQLTTLNYPVQVDGLGTVEATDTVVAICGPDFRDRQSVADVMPRPAADTGAVLLAIAADDGSSSAEARGCRHHDPSAPTAGADGGRPAGLRAFRAFGLADRGRHRAGSGRTDQQQRLPDCGPPAAGNRRQCRHRCVTKPD